VHDTLNESCKADESILDLIIQILVAVLGNQLNHGHKYSNMERIYAVCIIGINQQIKFAQ